MDQLLRDHMLHECGHGSNDILSAACAASREDAFACIAEIRAHNRRWPPLPTSARPTDGDGNRCKSVAGAAESMLDRHAAAGPVFQLVCQWGTSESPSKKRRTPSGAVRALTQMVHPCSTLRTVATFTRSIIPALAQEAQG